MADEQRKRRLVFGLLACVAIALVLWFIFHKPAQKPAPPPAIPVTAVKVVEQNLPIAVTSLGAAKAWTSATIYAQASGRLIRVNFREGSDVRAGQVLAEVDPAPYRALLMQALGTLHRDQAVLAEAQVNLARYQTLVQQDSLARQTLEDQRATVAQDRGTVEIDQGAVATARINLGYCRIVSPVSGRAGVRLVDPGNLVSASGSTASTPSTAAATSNTPASSGATSGTTSSASGSGIVVINQIQPIAVTFTVPEGQFEHLGQLTNGFHKSLAVQALSQESGELLDSGTVQIADNAVDPATGSVEMKARFANAGRRLWPGQFINVKLAQETLQNVAVIPISAVNRGPKGEYAFVIGKDGKATMRPLVVLMIQGTQAAVKSGVKPGEMVVTDGQMTLKPGSAVRVMKPASETGQ
jgi:multidrug efflux system membrane fusion protein